jgi:DNA-binding transcriptional LysR family regulator
MLDARTLKMFVTLAEELHFGRTAERLGVAQSVLSAQIMRIEDRIGSRLFDRGRRAAISLTRAGRAFLVEAQAAVEQLERAERIGRMAGRGEAGPIKAGFVLSAALSGCLPAALAAIRAELPLIEVQAEPMETPELIAAVADGRLDLAFIRPRPAYPANVEVRIVHREELLVALPTGHALAVRSAIASAELAGETFIFPQFSDTEGFGDTIARLSGAGLFHPGATVRTRDFVTAICLCAAGYGVVLAPRCMTNFTLPGVVFRSLADHRDQAHLALAWGPTAAPKVIEIVLDALAQVQPDPK